jgi:hypothetical protein
MLLSVVGPKNSDYAKPPHILWGAGGYSATNQTFK